MLWSAPSISAFPTNVSCFSYVKAELAMRMYWKGCLQWGFTGCMTIQFSNVEEIFPSVWFILSLGPSHLFSLLKKGSICSIRWQSGLLCHRREQCGLDGFMVLWKVCPWLDVWRQSWKRFLDQISSIGVCSTLVYRFQQEGSVHIKVRACCCVTENHAHSTYCLDRILT